MSNALALGAVTAVLRDLLNNGLIDQDMTGTIGGNVSVTALPPDRIDVGENREKSQLNLFLYQVTPNQGWRNVGLPSRDARGDRVAVVRELAPRAQECLLRSPQLVEPCLDLGETGLVGVVRDPLSLLDRALASVEGRAQLVQLSRSALEHRGALRERRFVPVIGRFRGTVRRH